MSDDYRDRIRKSIEKFHAKDLREIERLGGRGKRNKKPEKEVEKDCLKWMRALGWDVNIYEAKAILTKSGERVNSHMPPGVSDCMGITPYGEPAYVEFKAKGSRSTFNLEKRHKQKEFMLNKIKRHGFGCVVDSVTMLDETYNHWRSLRLKGLTKEARQYLFDCLPKKRKAVDVPRSSSTALNN